MNHDATFRPVMIAGFVAVVLVTLYHRIRAAKAKESLDRQQEGLFILATLRPIALLLWLGIIAYMINPAVMAWSSVPLPVWLRWSGAGVGVAAVVLLTWTLRSLGPNLTDTVVTRRAHTLVTTGPYRWVRHPFYVSMTLFILTNVLLAANWFLLVTGVLVVALIVLRTSREEDRLRARFGDAWQTYMSQTGRFLPRV